MQEQAISFLPVFRKECTSCSHLVKHAKLTFDECHFTKGNALCPAKINYIGVGVNIEKASESIANAIIEGDAVKLAKLTERLKGFESKETIQVLARVRELCMNSYGLSIETDGTIVQVGEEEEADDGDTEVEVEGLEDDDVEAEDGEDGEEDEDPADEEQDSEEDFNVEALNAAIDERVMLILTQHGLLKEPLNPALPPVVVQTPEGAQVAEGTDAVVKLESPAPTTPSAPAADDEWSET